MRQDLRSTPQKKKEGPHPIVLDPALHTVGAVDHIIVAPITVVPIRVVRIIPVRQFHIVRVLEVRTEVDQGHVNLITRPRLAIPEDHIIRVAEARAVAKVKVVVGHRRNNQMPMT